MNATDLFLAEKSMMGCSARTLALYRYYLDKFHAADPIPSSQDTLRLWLSRWPNPRTRHCAFRIAKTFIRWLASRGDCADWIAGFAIRCQTAAPHPTLSVAEFERIAAIMPATPQGIRDRAIYSTLFYTGTRRDAVRLLKPNALDLEGRWIRIVSKGGKEQLLSVPAVAVARLAAWLEIRPASDWLFPSLTKPTSPVDAAHVTRLLPLYAGAAGFTRRIFVHILRHSHATLLIDNDVPLHIVQAALGHADIKTTLGYTRQSTGRIREATDRVFG